MVTFDFTSIYCNISSMNEVNRLSPFELKKIRKNFYTQQLNKIFITDGMEIFLNS